ncbi:hypothetical protein HOLleu_18340 [Holothuria leucospilota]|uniref:Uncharacterized protein n=1 Tax=Holothuria leucospilota TaxID=206669 RepID=A0A9Q1C2N7_HOLLE|nr:hypothetical protein HOLleu_18340 [Holothuria leucospilota]
MNNHNQHQNDHVKLPHSSIEASHAASKPRKGHFARKSTGNNVKHTIQLSKKEKTKQQLPTQDGQNCTRSVKLYSITDTANSDSTPKKLESSLQAEDVKDIHQISKKEDQKDPKGPNVSTRASKQKQTLGSPSGKTEKNGEQQYAPFTKEKVVITKSAKLEDKENVGKGKNFNKDEKSCVFKRNTLLSGNTKAGIHPESKDSAKLLVGDKKILFASTQSHQDTQNSLENSSRKLDTKLEIVTSELHLDLKSHPKQLSETVKKRERASTPTPESPGRKSDTLSRKRHRSESPKICSSEVESNRDLIAKPHKEPIMLHTKNYEKVKNACKNAISQRKDKTTNKVDAENAKPVEVVCSKISPNCKEHSVSDQSRTQSVKDQQPLPDRHEPASKKAKLSLTGDVKLNVSHKEMAKSPMESSKASAGHPHTDSDDGLARLMKDFQSAIVASTTQKSIHGAAPKHKYISKKTSQHAVVAKSQKKSFHTQTERKEDSKKSVSFKPSHNLKKLVPIPTEPVSSDEECEHPTSDVDSKTSDGGVSNVTEKPSEKDFQNIKKGQHCTDAVRPRVKIPELIAPSNPSPDKLVIVDQIGFPTTEDSNNLSKSIHNVSESQKTSSDKTLECNHLPHGSGGGNQLSEGGVALGKGQIYSPMTDKAQEFNKTAIGNKNITCEKDALKNGYSDGNLNSSDTSGDTLQHAGQKSDSQRSNLKREYERVSQQGDGKKPKICHEVVSVALESHYTQTDEVVISKEDKATGTEVSGKRDVKNQATQFDGEPSDLDTEEISRIVAAMYESECEEKERLVQALQVQKEREEKWRKIAQDCAKQLQELKDKLECKGKETREQGTNTSEGSSSTALPVIISSQSTQTEKVHTKPTPIVIPTEEKTISSTPVVPGLLPSEAKKDLPQSVLPSATVTDKVESVPSSATTSAAKLNSASERKLPVGPSIAIRESQEISKQTYPVQNVSKNQTPARTLSAPSGNTKLQNEISPSSSIQQNGIVKHATSDKNAKGEASKDVTVIDLTDTEDVNSSESTNSTPSKRPPVQSRSTVLPGKIVQGSPINLRKSPGIPSKPNVLQLTSKAGTKEQLIENKVKPLTSSILPPDKASVIPKRSQPSSSVQGIQRVVQTKPVQNAGTMKVSTNLPVNQLVTIGQPIVAVPPPRLQAAPSIAGSIYSPQSTQMPVFSTIGNIGMIIGNQPQPRQEGAMQGVLQTHGIMQRPLLTQGQANILNQKVILEKRQQELQQQLTQCYQRSNNKKVSEISVQLQAVMTELRNIKDRLNAPVQGQRNMRVAQVSAPPNVATQGKVLQSTVLGVVLLFHRGSGATWHSLHIT